MFPGRVDPQTNWKVQLSEARTARPLHLTRKNAHMKMIFIYFLNISIICRVSRFYKCNVFFSVSELHVFHQNLDWNNKTMMWCHYWKRTNRIPAVGCQHGEDKQEEMLPDHTHTHAHTPQKSPWKSSNRKRFSGLMSSCRRDRENPTSKVTTVHFLATLLCKKSYCRSKTPVLIIFNLTL